MSKQALRSWQDAPTFSHTHPASAAVFGSSDIFSDWVAFVEADGHGVADSHVCNTSSR